MRYNQLIPPILEYLEKRQSRSLLAIVLLAIFLRLFWVFVIDPIRNPGPYTGDHYYIIAENLVNGYGFSDNIGDEKIKDLRRLPLYTFFLAGIYKVFGINFIAPKIFNCIIEGLSCALIYFLAFKLFNSKRVGLTSAFIYAIYVRGYFMSSKLITEPIYIFLLLFFFYILICWINNFNIKNAILAGIILGLLSLTRSITQFFPIVILFILFWYRKKLINIYSAYIYFILSFCFVLTPWIYRNYLVTGKTNLIVSSDYGYALWEKTEFDFNMLVHRDKETYSKIILARKEIIDSHNGDQYSAANTMVKIYANDLISNPIKHVILYFKQLIAFWYLSSSKSNSIINMIINFPILIFGFLGMIKASKNGIYALPFILLVLYFNMIHAAVWVFFRYSIPMIPFLIIFAVYFLLIDKDYRYLKPENYI